MITNERQDATEDNDCSGFPGPSDEYSFTAGPGGPTLLQDHYLNQERIPERVVHAKRGAAHGSFEVTKDITWLTQAAFLSKRE